MIRVTLAGLLARRRRLVLSGAAVVLGVMFVSASFVLTDTLGRAFGALYSGAGAGPDVRVTARQLPGEGDAAATTPVPASLVAKAGAVVGVASATGVVSEDGARLIGADGKAVTTSFRRARLGTAWTITERTQEIGLIRIAGLDRRQTMSMITVEAVAIAVFGATLGTAAGVGLGATVVRALHAEGIEKLALPYELLAAYVALGAAVGGLAAIPPAIRAARTDVLRAIAHA